MLVYIGMNAHMPLKAIRPEIILLQGLYLKQLIKEVHKGLHESVFINYS